MLSILEGTSMMAQQAMHKGSKLKHEDSHNLDFYFDKVSPFMPIPTEYSHSCLYAAAEPCMCLRICSCLTYCQCFIPRLLAA